MDLISPKDRSTHRPQDVCFVLCRLQNRTIPRDLCKDTPKSKQKTNSELHGDASKKREGCMYRDVGDVHHLNPVPHEQHHRLTWNWQVSCDNGPTTDRYLGPKLKFAAVKATTTSKWNPIFLTVCKAGRPHRRPDLLCQKKILEKSWLPNRRPETPWFCWNL